MRLTSFTERAPLADALAWVDAHASRLGSEPVPLEAALNRVLATPVRCPANWPAEDRAALDGYAVRAAATEGADAYAPLPLAASVVAMGEPMPPGADAVLPFEAASPGGTGGLEALLAVARGHGVDRAGAVYCAGQELLPAGRVLRPEDMALLVVLGIPGVETVCRPRVHLVVPGPKGGGADALTPMLLGLVARDGGVGETAPRPPADETGLARTCAAAAEGVDLLLVAGRSGAGPDDVAAGALLQAGGTLDLHGVAMRPGVSAGLGRLGAALAVLLPGDPLGCLSAYEMLVAPALRCMVGLPAPARVVVPAVLHAKLVSTAGYAELVRVRLDGERAVPLGTAEASGLPPGADGFVLVPEAGEGFPAGRTVEVHLG